MNTMDEGVENAAAEALAGQLAQGLAKAMERKLEEVGRARSLSAKGARAAIFGDGGGGVRGLAGAHGGADAVLKLLCDVVHGAPSKTG